MFMCPHIFIFRFHLFKQAVGMSDVKILAWREFLKIGAGANLHTVKFEIPLDHENVFIS